MATQETVIASIPQATSCPLARIRFWNAASRHASVGGVRNVTPTHAAVVTAITMSSRCQARSDGKPRCG